MVLPTSHQHVRQNNEYQENIVQPDFRLQMIESPNRVCRMHLSMLINMVMFSKVLGWTMKEEVYLWVNLYIR